MAHDRPFRFAVHATAAVRPTDWMAFARRVEELGYTTLVLPDHLWDQLGPLTAAMAAAAATRTLRIGALVLNNDFRNPAVLAKELATIDALSEGRLEIGLGAGWMTRDYEWSGITRDEARVRTERLAEAIQVLKGLFGPEAVDFQGRHYNVRALDGSPKPFQQPHPPFIIGGGGRQLLSLAAREADIVSINRALRSGEMDYASIMDATAAATDRKLRWVREAAGERFDELEVNMLVPWVRVSDDRDSALEALSKETDVAPDELVEMPHAWVGSIDVICRDLEARRERWGVSYYVVPAHAVEAAAPIVERLAGA